MQKSLCERSNRTSKCEANESKTRRSKMHALVRMVLGCLSKALKYTIKPADTSCQRKLIRDGHWQQEKSSVGIARIRTVWICYENLREFCNCGATNVCASFKMHSLITLAAFFLTLSFIFVVYLLEVCAVWLNANRNVQSFWTFFLHSHVFWLFGCLSFFIVIPMRPEKIIIGCHVIWTERKKNNQQLAVHAGNCIVHNTIFVRSITLIGLTNCWPSRMRHCKK